MQVNCKQRLCGPQRWLSPTIEMCAYGYEFGLPSACYKCISNCMPGRHILCQCFPIYMPTCLLLDDALYMQDHLCAWRLVLFRSWFPSPLLFTSLPVFFEALKALLVPFALPFATGAVCMYQSKYGNRILWMLLINRCLGNLGIVTWHKHLSTCSYTCTHDSYQSTCAHWDWCCIGTKEHNKWQIAAEKSNDSIWWMPYLCFLHIVVVKGDLAALGCNPCMECNV